MLVHWIWLATRQGVSDRLKVALLEKFGDAEQIYFAFSAEDSGDDISPKALENLADKDLTSARQILDECVDKQIRIMTIRDAAYPGKLKNIPDPPVVLYYKGQLPDMDDRPTIGVVGTRKASAYGLTTAKKMGYQIAACGGIVVSGLASGIDAKSMEGALSAGMSVVGVLGCGVDMIYPYENRWLFRDTERYGCILSEFPPRTPPYGQNFPIRNRIISGLSDGVLVVEAPEKSGALITAKRAADQGRDVFVIPANIDMPSAAGSNLLLRDGAIAVGSGWDVVSEYSGRYEGLVQRNTAGEELKAYPDEVDQAREIEERLSLKVAQKIEKPRKKQPHGETPEKKVIDNSENSPYIDLTKKELSLSEEERVIVDLLSRGQMHVDELIDQSGFAPGQMLSKLTMLEIKRVIRRLPGNFVCLRRGE